PVRQGRARIQRDSDHARLQLVRVEGRMQRTLLSWRGSNACRDKDDCYCQTPRPPHYLVLALGFGSRSSPSFIARKLRLLSSSEPDSVMVLISALNARLRSPGFGCEFIIPASSEPDSPGSFRRSSARTAPSGLQLARNML